MTNRFILLILLFHFNSCSSEKRKRINTGDGYIAEGNISKDTIYNGLINFYDLTTGKLVIKSNYRNDTLEGKREDYYLNGKLKTTSFYKDGKTDGWVKMYDSTGKLTFEQLFYYDLPNGHAIAYQNGKMSEYSFFSFDNAALFQLDYDSISKKNIEQINNNQFFFYNVLDMSNGGFIYLPNPPKFNFKYSLCIIADKYKLISEVKKFDMSKTWETFNLDNTQLKAGEDFALRLEALPEINNDKRHTYTMFKKL